VAGWWLLYTWDVFSHCGEVKMLVRTVRNVIFITEKPGTFDATNWILWVTGAEVSKTHKTGTKGIPIFSQISLQNFSFWFPAL
jgi:hypothetical protein